MYKTSFCKSGHIFVWVANIQQNKLTLHVTDYSKHQNSYSEIWIYSSAFSYFTTVSYIIPKYRYTLMTSLVIVGCSLKIWSSTGRVCQTYSVPALSIYLASQLVKWFQLSLSMMELEFQYDSLNFPVKNIAQPFYLQTT